MITPYLPETIKGSVIAIHEALDVLCTDDIDTEQANTLVHIQDMLLNMATMLGFNDLFSGNDNE